MIYSRANDVPYMEPARQYFKESITPYEETILSAHHNLMALLDYLKKIGESEEKIVILAIASLGTALPGIVATNTELPVIGVPVPSGPLNGIEALLSMSQLPGGVPAPAVGLHQEAPANAAMAAHRILKLAEA